MLFVLLFFIGVFLAFCWGSCADWHFLSEDALALRKWNPRVGILISKSYGFLLFLLLLTVPFELSRKNGIVPGLISLFMFSPVLLGTFLGSTCAHGAWHEAGGIRSSNGFEYHLRTFYSKKRDGTYVQLLTAREARGRFIWRDRVIAVVKTKMKYSDERMMDSPSYSAPVLEEGEKYVSVYESGGQGLLLRVDRLTGRMIRPSVEPAEAIPAMSTVALFVGVDRPNNYSVEIGN